MKKTIKSNQKILDLINKVLKINIDNAKIDNIDMNKIPQWDSVAHVEIISSLEDEYKIEFTTEEIPLLTNVKNIEEIIVKKTKNKLVSFKIKK